MPDPHELDPILDLVLADYAKPPAGLEERVLARVFGETRPSPRRRWVLVAIAAPIAVCLLLFTYRMPKALHSWSAAVANQPSESSVRPAAAPRIEWPPRVVVGKQIDRRRRVQEGIRPSVPPRPKLELFPTPQPPTAEERALSQLASQTTDAERKAIVETREQAGAPIEITAIRIPPLLVSESDKK